MNDNKPFNFPIDVYQEYDTVSQEVAEHEDSRREVLIDEKNEQTQLDEIFKKAPSFMCILRGPDHIMVWANNLYYQLVRNSDIIGKPVRESIPEAKEQGFIELLDHVYQSGKTFTGTEMRISLRRQDNTTEERYLDFVYQPLRESDGTVNGIFVQGVDLTDRKRATEELQKMNNTLEERVEARTAEMLSYQNHLRDLVSRLSCAEEYERQRLATELHDNLGQILTIGKMKLNQLQKIASGNPIQNRSDELAELMNEALRYTRELMLDLKPPPSLNKENLKKSVAWVAGKMEKYNLEVTIEDDEQPKPLSDDVQTTLRQCIRELLFNVLKHAQVNEARISLSRKNEQVQIIVEDRGCGFEPNKKDLLPGKEKGFGLFNIFERLDLLDGSFEIISATGKGTKAILLVPVTGEKKSAGSEDEGGMPSELKDLSTETMSIKNQRNSKIRVLLADDHQMMREGLRKIIEEEEDLTIIAEASDGEEAVKLAYEISPDVIVMDVNMPRVNGIEATRKIISKNQNIRIIGLSLHDSPNVAESMKNAGASAYLTKTEAIEDLCATIRHEANNKKV